MKGFKPFRERKVPSGILKDFDAEVKRKILQGRSPWGALGAGISVAALALLFVFLLLWRQAPETRVSTKTAAPVVIAEREDVQELEITDEVEILKAVGAWTEDDDLALGISVENAVTELELASVQLPL